MTPANHAEIAREPDRLQAAVRAHTARLVALGLSQEQAQRAAEAAFAEATSVLEAATSANADARDRLCRVRTLLSSAYETANQPARLGRTWARYPVAEAKRLIDCLFQLRLMLSVPFLHEVPDESTH